MATSETIETDEFDRVMAINVRGTFLMGRAAAPHMRARKWGRIVNIASVAGRTGSKMNSAYAASKAGVIALTQTWALDLGPDGITSNAVLPGFIFTTRTLSGMSKKLGGAVIDRGSDRASRRPMFPSAVPDRRKTWRRPSPSSLRTTPAITNGQSLIVDGGSLRL